MDSIYWSCPVLTLKQFFRFFSFFYFFFLGLVLNELRPVHLIKDGSRVRCQKISEQDLKPKGWNSPQPTHTHTHHATRYSLFYLGTLCCDESTWPQGITTAPGSLTHLGTKVSQVSLQQQLCERFLSCPHNWVSQPRVSPATGEINWTPVLLRMWMQPPNCFPSPGCSLKTGGKLDYSCLACKVRD